ncbi:MAG: helix-turn-helix transcriptional regulator [Synergistaceae bacterium]|jgi:DNA-binding XRE family transcriptional regulator|nr:helix-turn-helix transcriptional regulator [Synergistaceae bacterium]
MTNKHLGSTWQELKDELVKRGALTQEDMRVSALRVALIGELIEARKEKGLSQQELEQISGVKRPVISRMESGSVMCQIDTVLKVLAPLGKKLAIVPIDQEERTV